MDLVAPDHLSGVVVRKWPAQGRAEALAARVDEHGAAALEERLGEPVGARRGEAHLGFGLASGAGGGGGVGVGSGFGLGVGSG